MKMVRIKGFKLVDLLGVGVFVAILVLAVMILLRRAEYVTMVLKVTDSGYLGNNPLPMWYLDKFKGGMEQKDVLGRSSISILKSYSYPTNKDSRVMYLTMRLLAAYDKKNKSYSFEGVPLLLGSYQTFKFNGMLLRGVVYRIEDIDQPVEEKTLEVSGVLNPANNMNQDPYVAEMTTDGIKNYLATKIVKDLRVKDSDGLVVAEVREVDLSPSYRKFIAGNRIVSVVDNDRKNVAMKVVVKVKKFGDVYLFREDMPITINANVWLDFWDFQVNMTITDFKEI